jgi:hypothetical protein
MIQYGGSFAKNLAYAAMAADESNYNKLFNAFKDLFDEYRIRFTGKNIKKVNGI